MIEIIKMDRPVVLFREDTCLEDNLLNLLKDLYDFQEPCRDNTPWLYFVERLERFLEDCRSPNEKWYLESLITIFQLHHFVNYQHISFAVLELSRWLSSIDREETSLFQHTNDNYFCCVCKKYLLQVTKALFFRISFYGEHFLENNNITFQMSCYRDEFYHRTLSSLLGNEPLLTLSIWCDWSALYQHENKSSWDTFLDPLYSTTESNEYDATEKRTSGVHCWKAVWIRPTWYVKWLQGYKPCIVSFIMEIHRSGRLGKVLKAKDAKTGVFYWICCINWLYTVVLMMPESNTCQDIYSIDYKILLWIKEFCWNLQRISDIEDAVFQ